MDLESAARELKMLASKERLTPSELKRAKYLMVLLKGWNMTNREIEELTGGRWSVSTIKGYTRGVGATDPEPWQSTTALFSEMLAKNLTLGDVSEAMTIRAELESKGSSLDDVVSFMQELKERGVSLSQLGEGVSVNADLRTKGTSPAELASFIAELEKEKVSVPDFVSLLRDWQEAGLTPRDARSVLGYRTQLEENEIDIETLSHVANAAREFGNAGQVLEAIAKYGYLVKMDEEAQTKQKQLDAMATEMESRSQETATASQKLQELQNKAGAIEAALTTYRRLEAIGFNEKALSELAKAANNYGTPSTVLKAVNRFGSLSRIKEVDDELRDKVKQKRAMITSLDDQYAHLKEPIELCRALLKRGFSLGVLVAINAAASRYGESIEVMKAIEAYGALKEIEKKNKEANTEFAGRQAKIQRLKEAEAEYEARNKAILEQFEVLNAKAIEIGRTAGSVQEQLKGDTMARDLLLLLRNPGSVSYENSLPLVIVVLKAILIWSIMNKGKLRYAATTQRSMEDALGSLGGS